MKRWTANEDRVITHNWSKYNDFQLTALLLSECSTVRTEEAVSIRRRVKLKFYRGWTDAEERVIEGNGDKTAAELAEMLPGRTIRAIEQKRWRMKVRCDDCELESGCIEQPNTIGCNEYRKEHLTKPSK